VLPSADKSPYDGAFESLSQPDAPKFAFFHVHPESDGIIFPFSQFPRNAKGGDFTSLALVDLFIVWKNIQCGTLRLYHLATTPTQIGRWAFRTYQVHVAVAPSQFWSFLDGKFHVMDAQTNRVFCADQSGSTFGTCVQFSYSTFLFRQEVCYTVSLAIRDGILTE